MHVHFGCPDSERIRIHRSCQSNRTITSTRARPPPIRRPRQGAPGARGLRRRGVQRPYRRPPDARRGRPVTEPDLLGRIGTPSSSCRSAGHTGWAVRFVGDPQRIGTPADLVEHFERNSMCDDGGRGSGGRMFAIRVAGLTTRTPARAPAASGSSSPPAPTSAGPARRDARGSRSTSAPPAATSRSRRWPAAAGTPCSRCRRR
jgi:hypothetical protein